MCYYFLLFGPEFVPSDSRVEIPRRLPSRGAEIESPRSPLGDFARMGRPRTRLDATTVLTPAGRAALPDVIMIRTLKLFRRGPIDWASGSASLRAKFEPVCNLSLPALNDEPRHE